MTQPAIRRKPAPLILLGVLVVCLFCYFLLRDIRNAPATEQKAEATSPSPALLALAQDHFTRGDPAAALETLAKVLDHDPQNALASQLAQDILNTTLWPTAIEQINIGHPISHLAPAGKSALFITLNGPADTTMRWNIPETKIDSILFPLHGAHTRGVVASPSGKHVVIERKGLTLLCDGETLKPVRDLPSLPANLPPACAVAFSANELLFAHAESTTKHSTIWHIRDTATGEILRSSEATPEPTSLCAWFELQALHVLRSDGSTLVLPISPTAPAAVEKAKSPTRLIAACRLADPPVTLALRDEGPFTQPRILTYPSGNDAPPLESLPDSLLAAFPWSSQPNPWSTVLQHLPGILDVKPSAIRNIATHAAPIQLPHPATAVAAFPGTCWIADEQGTLTRYTFTKRDDKILAAGPSSPSPWQGHPVPAFPPQTLTPLTNRLAEATPNDHSPQLTALQTTFTNGTPEEISAAITQVGSSGPLAANALALALTSSHPEWIEQSIGQAENLPPLLAKLAHSRIAWLRERKTEAMAPWTQGFPDLAHIRACEDWQGWEQADFAPALELAKTTRAQHLSDYTLTADTPADQRDEIATRLLTPDALQTLGRPELARLALQAATTLAISKDHKEQTFRLAALARRLGAPPAPCLRAEATALTSLGDYAAAHERWISLISDSPLPDQLPSDYTEAAYTAHENADSRQAMIILATGLQRFPENAEFALRAGWVSLLADQPERAYAFLLSGQRTGYPEDLRENATALLAVAAAMTGDDISADGFRALLAEQNPAWADDSTIDSLDWPEILKQHLRPPEPQYPVAIPVDPAELDPATTPLDLPPEDALPLPSADDLALPPMKQSASE